MNGSEIGASDGAFLGNLQMNSDLAKRAVFWSETFWMEPGLVNWTGFCMESPFGGEHWVAEGFFLVNFPDGPRLGDVEGVLVRGW